MRTLIVSDIHSNLEALEAVIRDCKGRGGFDQLWSLGDSVGYGPDPEACLHLLKDYGVVAVAGNHDLAAAGRLSLEAFNEHAAIANRWTSTQLSQEMSADLRTYPLRREVGDFTLVHGSPRDPVWEYVISVRAAVTSFLHFMTAYCLVGHSHVPFLCSPSGENGASFAEFPNDTPIELDDSRLIVNPGSVGQPRDGDPRASYAVYDEDAGVILHHRAMYDIAATQAKMEGHGLPQFLIERLSKGR